MEIQEYQNGAFTVSTDKAKLDLSAIHAYLSRSYWAEGISLEIVRRSVENSLCFGLYDDSSQIGLARVISDYATYAYVCDVYVLEAYRGQGLGKWLMHCVMAHPDLQGLRRWSLATRDAHGLYEQAGFTALSNPQGYMEIRHSDLYREPPDTL